MSGMTVKFDGADALAGLDALAEGVEKAIRPAAQAGAQVFYNEVKTRVSAIGRITGNLDRSIYQVYSDRSTPEEAVYHVSWNAAKAPHGHLVEFGHIQTHKVYVGSDGNWYTSKTPLDQPKRVGARPFLRPAFDAAFARALEAANERFMEGMRKAIGGAG